jgi:uncharacterized damage-inducible protein DinB
MIRFDEPVFVSTALRTVREVVARRVWLVVLWLGGGAMRKVPGDGSGEIGRVLVESYGVNERMNQVLLEHLDPAAWRASLPESKGRTIVAIITHVHNIRRKWLRLSAPQIKLPAALNRASCTQKQARVALAESGARCSEMIAGALGGAGSGVPGRVRIFHRDGWAKPWPAGASMVAYMISHDAHHRGQVCMLAHQLGFPLPQKATYGMWGWEKLWKECGFTQPR